MADTAPVLEEVLEPVTPELRAPLLLCELFSSPVGTLLAWLGVSTPLRPACDKPLLPELAATLELVLPLLVSVGDEVAAEVELVPALAVLAAVKVQLTCRSM